MTKRSRCGASRMRGIFPRATLLQLSLESLIFQRTLLFTGKPIEIDGAIHAEQSSEGILIVGAPVPPENLIRGGFAQ
jgi:hypothetical protein